VGGTTASSAPSVPADSRRKLRREIVDIVILPHDSAINRGFKAAERDGPRNRLDEPPIVGTMPCHIGRGLSSGQNDV
jgi:hypothetical protein